MAVDKIGFATVAILDAEAEKVQYKINFSNFLKIYDYYNQF